MGRRGTATKTQYVCTRLMVIWTSETYLFAGGLGLREAKVLVLLKHLLLLVDPVALCLPGRGVVPEDEREVQAVVHDGNATVSVASTHDGGMG